MSAPTGSTVITCSERLGVVTRRGKRKRERISGGGRVSVTNRLWTHLGFLFYVSFLALARLSFSQPTGSVDTNETLLTAASASVEAGSSSSDLNRVRSGRQVFPGADSCSFGSGDQPELCGWSHSNLSSLHWELSHGLNSNWIGGPVEDGSEDKEGGYLVFETSQIPNISGRSSQSAVLEGPVHPPTSALGGCLSFKYSLDGLSPEKMRVLLHPILQSEGRYVFDGLSQLLSRDGDHGQDVVLWETRDSTDGKWRTAEVVYTCRHPHQIYLEGIPREPSQLSRRYRGFIAIDDVMFKTADQCPGHCTFDGGLCDWTNEQQDDFDWTLGRGSQNPATGPIMDRASYTHGGSSGGYAFIDSSFPRRSGDRARLSSREFSSTKGDSPLCMRFWTHMYGNGIGTLRVIVHDVEDDQDRVIWSLSGEAGNAWYQGQVPISSFTAFKIVFEGEVGKNNLGDIAIDDLSFAPGACPSAPQTAAGLSGDCTFEIDECGWANVGPASRTDEMDWERRLGSNARTAISDHTIGSPTGNFMTLSGLSVQRAGDRAWMTSPSFNGSSKPRCISFWYYMHEPFIDTSGPSLGGLKVYTKPAPSASSNNDLAYHQPKMTPIWRLYNQQAPVWKYAQAKFMEAEPVQIVFEGIHGSSRANGFVGIDDIAFFEGDCTTMPESAYVNEGECSFEKDMCNWKNTSSDLVYRWQLATITRRPANLPDKTFGAPVGYAYFDIFSQNPQGPPVRLVSMVPATGDRMCFSFWYAGFGAGESTVLRVLTAEPKSPDSDSSDDDEGTQVWKLTAANLNTQSPIWRPAQVSMDGSNPMRIILEGQANNGGFAIDDISFHPGECTIRPKEAGNTE
ncbi:unnamed protein product [Orchesella dallaii]|uniref:MAM domain-containing protein n=1 Tax=Orchesella dallaii TaxID=48710 RepID=A0ABP1QPJ2_9HEXA